MTKIAIIGAGGYEFPLQLMNDFLSFESTQDAHFALMDIDPQSLARTERLARRAGRRPRPSREDRADHRPAPPRWPAPTSSSSASRSGA